MTDRQAIHILPESIANKIAAGEVVERPASVVKELMENAIDAGATKVSVVVEAAGMKKIQVVDNGVGMSPDDLSLAIVRHATSKISSDDDLQAISTLGFRGEALPSIAAVSHLEIVTRRGEDLGGSWLAAQGGTMVEQGEKGSSAGTTVTITQLFYNTPARKEFLKAAPAENAVISEMITRFALAHPHAAISLVSDGQKVFQSGGQNRRLDVIADVYGSDIARKMLRVEGQDPGGSCRIEGFTAPPTVTRSNKKHILTFINSRWVKSPALEGAVIKAYETLLPLHRFPISILSLQIDPREMDVNVHPAKLEVRFHHESRIVEFVKGSVLETLMGHELVPEVYIKSPDPHKDQVTQGSISFDSPVESSSSHIQRKSGKTLDNDHPLDLISDSDSDSWVKEPAVQFYDAPEKPQDPIRIIGQVFRTYILMIHQEELLIVDQHAAQERTMYEKLIRNLSHEQPAQQLLMPEVMELTPAEKDMLCEHESILQEIGFNFDEASGRSVFLRAIPDGLHRDGAADLFRSVLESIGDAPARHTPDRMEAVIRAACRASVKANDSLSQREMAELVTQLFAAQNPYTCPHGRPTMLRFSQSELEKMFKRV